MAPAARRAATSPPAIVIVGDVLLAGRAERLAQREGPLAPFSEVVDVMRQADLAIANLECALTTAGRPADKQFTFRAHPSSAASLSAAGLDLVTLANNHSADYGARSLLDTIAALRSHGIRAVGAGRNLHEAGRHAVFDCGSPPVKIAVLGFSNMRPTSFYAASDRPGTSPAWADLVAPRVREAREEADVVVALFHWGEELSSSPSAVQRRLAHVAADSGADLVVGHHPHVLQGMEVRGRALIIYSLGNFLFPSRGECRRTMILRYTPAPSGRARAEIIPCVIDGFRPRLAVDGERAEILSHIAALSGDLGCELLAGNGQIALPARPVDNVNRSP
jgi:poly-gamma-glutamate synthesis protein (capsule biosynthesis protein)